MNESNFSPEEQEVLKEYFIKVQGDIIDRLTDFRFGMSDEVLGLLHSDAHWTPKAGCNIPDAKTIMGLDSRNKDEIRDYLMTLICKGIIDHCEEVLFHLQND